MTTVDYDEVKTGYTFDEMAAWGIVLFAYYLERIGISSEDELKEAMESHKRTWLCSNVYDSIVHFLTFYNKTWSDAGGDLIKPVAGYFGLNADESPKRLVEICPDQTAIIQLGVGPYIESDKEVPYDVWTVIAKQLGIKNRALK
ncbi:MAG: hypothetical protein IPN69_13805 [Acidobacteria bacterium]|nr:hypothetical protein [Acidobacteriota bacterium]MBK8148192.1 hypothetical protein [Acidobacteriota bacterium]MBK8811791.1 hypothetical protein [Acidobacteriota bacterium]